MRGTPEPGCASVIICQNVREECRLTPMECKGRKYVDLRTYRRDQESNKTRPTDKRITVDLALWPQFREAVSSPETWTRFLPFGNHQVSRDLSKGRLIFPEEALHKFPQEQIFLEHKDFQGIPFVFLKTLSRTTRNRHFSLATIGPLLWSQFLTGLSKVEETLFDLGWLAGKDRGTKSRLTRPATRKKLQPWPVM